MKSIIHFLHVLIILTCGLVSGFGQQIRIMTYNIHHGADASEQPTLDSMGYYIRESGVDIVGLQEVDSICHRSNGVDQPERLAEITGLDHYFTRHFPYQGGAYGQGLLSTYGVSKVRNLRLPVFPLEEEKGVSVLLAEVQTAPDSVITIGVVHLDYRSSESRMHQIDLLLDSLSVIKNLVLLGDFNAYPDSPEILKLLQYFDRFEAKIESPSFPALNPDRRIDFVFVRKGSDLKIVNESVQQVPYSDHLPVTTVLTYD